MGEVYLARVRGPFQFAKLFTIKLMKTEFADDAADLQRFAREARIAARLTHHNLVQAYDFGSYKGRYFLVMEYIDGLNLAKLLRRMQLCKRLLPWNHAAFIAAEVAAALNFMHTLKDEDGQYLNLTHRDVSPENILLSVEGEVKLVDFGLVKYRGAEKLTGKGRVRGKLSYMAPERAVGGESQPYSDQFSLGLVLHEMITGKRYLEPELDRQALQRKLLHEPIAPPSRLIGLVPEKLEAIVMRATSLEPAQRFASLKAMELELREFLLTDPQATGDNLLLKDTLSELVRALAMAEVEEDEDKKVINVAKLERKLSPFTRPPKDPSQGQSGELKGPRFTRFLRFFGQRLS
jgi:serine/threonine protein kinase